MPDALLSIENAGVFSDVPTEQPVVSYVFILHTDAEKADFPELRGLA